MLRILRMIAAAIVRTVVDVVTGLVRVVVEQVTGRDFAAEAAEAAQAEANARDAAAREAEVEARHEELVATIERLTRTAVTAKPEVRAKSVAERRRDIAAQSRSHDIEIRSSTWEPEAAIDDDAELGLRVA